MDGACGRGHPDPGGYPANPAGPEADGSARAARWINDDYLRLVADYPGKFRAYATLALPHVEASLSEWARIRQENFVGVSLPALLPGGRSIADAAFDPVWEALNDDSCVVNIHPTGQGGCAGPITDHHLEWVNGAPVEDAVAVLHLLKADIPRRFPNIRFHTAHLGGDLAFLAQRLEDNYSDWGSFPSSPQAALRAMYFDAANFWEPSLNLACETYGAGQVLAGSDFPYFQEDKYVRAFDYVRTSRLSDSDKQAVLRGNAERLFRL